jgi:hypothetical protein
MKFLFLMMILTSLNFAADKKVNLRISKQNHGEGGCDLYYAGFKSKEQFFTYFEKLKQAAATKDKNALADLMHFPLNTYAKDYPAMIKEKLVFINDFDKVMPQKLLDVIENQKITDISCRDQGVMLGSGEIWIGVRRDQVAVITLAPRFHGL